MLPGLHNEDEELHRCSVGQPLDDKHLLPEVSTLFMAGFESKPLYLSLSICS